MWTDEELAEMAAADAAIDAEFEDEATAYRLAREDTDYADELDRLAKADGLTRREERRRRMHAAYKKAYREANTRRNGPCDRLRQYRMGRGMTQRDLATVLGVSQSLIAQYENGRIPCDVDELLERLALKTKEKAPV